MIGFEGVRIESGKVHLILGAPGTGKVQWCRQASQKTTIVDCRNFCETNYPEVIDHLRVVSERDSAALIVLDHAETMLPSSAPAVSAHRRRAVVRRWICTSNATIVALCTRRSLIDAEFISMCGRLVFTVGNLSAEQRAAVMGKEWADPRVALHGFTRADVLRLLRVSALYSSLHEAVQHVAPAALLPQESVVCDTGGFSDIVGLECAKQTLYYGVVMPTVNPAKCSAFGVQLPRGVLITGPHGCGKTMMAKALAVETKLNVISVGAPDLVHKTVGDSEKAVASVFARARAVAPSILLLDQIEAFATPQQHEGTHTRDRLIAALISEMDSPGDGSVVIVVATAARESLVHPSLLAAGRLELQVVLDLPNETERTKLFMERIEKMCVAPDVTKEFVQNVLAPRTEGASASEIFAQCQAAALAALREDLSQQCIVDRKHFQ